MGWWQFKRKERVIDEEPHMRGARKWIQDVREVWERWYDDHEEGDRVMGERRAEWDEGGGRVGGEEWWVGGGGTWSSVTLHALEYCSGGAYHETDCRHTDILFMTTK